MSGLLKAWGLLSLLGYRIIVPRSGNMVCWRESQSWSQEQVNGEHGIGTALKMAKTYGEPAMFQALF